MGAEEEKRPEVNDPAGTEAKPWLTRRTREILDRSRRLKDDAANQPISLGPIQLSVSLSRESSLHGFLVSSHKPPSAFPAALNSRRLGPRDQTPQTKTHAVITSVRE